MKQKIHYRLYSGKLSQSIVPWTYKYSNTANIKMRVSQNGFEVNLYQTVKKESCSILRDFLFRDAIKKAAVIQLIKFGAFTEDDLYIEIEGNSSCIYSYSLNGDKPLIYSLCNKKLLRPMSSNWTDNSFTSILSVPKSRMGRRSAALESLLIAKSKAYETERFIYLWMAMNGLYGFTASKAVEKMNTDKEQRWVKKEHGQIKFFAMLFDYPYRGKYDKLEDTIVQKLELLLAETEIENIDQLMTAVISNDGDDFYVQKIRAIFADAGAEAGKMHPYVALLLYLSYKVRCKYFHAEQAIPLICFENEYPLPVLRVLNVIIERFLDENMYKWFDADIYNAEILPKINELASNCKCNKSSNLISCVVGGVEKA